MKRLTYVILFYFTFIVSACSKDSTEIINFGQPRHSMHPQSQINFIKNQIIDVKEPYYSAYIQLLYHADLILDVSANIVPDYNVPARYADPIGHATNSKPLQDDAFSAYCSALAYCLTDEPKYGLKACHFLNTWSSNNISYSGYDGSLVMSYSGTALLIAAELMIDKTIWNEEDKYNFKIWVQNVYQIAVNSIRARENNWGDWGIFGSLLVASLLEDETEIVENIRLLKSGIFKKIASDGSMPLEVVREDNGMWYTYFSLAPLTASCWIVYNLTGENIFELEEESISIKKALDYLLYYSLHSIEWKWYDNPTVGKPSSWPGNLIEAMSGIYNDENYINYVKDSRPIIYPTHHFAWTFPTLMPLKIGAYDY